MTAKSTRLRSACVLAGLFATTPAVAHVTLSEPHGKAGGYYVGYLRVGHGCAGSATTGLRVEIPPELPVVRPQRKPGWTLRIEHAPLSPPVRGEGGRMLDERVSAITWSGGPLPDDEWDEFGISAKLPARTGPLYLPAVQTCEQGEERWTDIPAPGQTPHATAHPAPTITLEPAVDDAMAGMKMGR